MSEQKVRIKESGHIGHLVYSEDGYYEIELDNGATMTFEDTSAFEPYVEQEPTAELEGPAVRECISRDDEIINGYEFPGPLILYTSIRVHAINQKLREIGGSATLWHGLNDEQKWNHIAVALGVHPVQLKDMLDSGELTKTKMTMAALSSLGDIVQASGL